MKNLRLSLAEWAKLIHEDLEKMRNAQNLPPSERKEAYLGLLKQMSDSTEILSPYSQHLPKKKIK